MFSEGRKWNGDIKIGNDIIIYYLKIFFKLRVKLKTIELKYFVILRKRRYQTIQESKWSLRNQKA